MSNSEYIPIQLPLLPYIYQNDSSRFTVIAVLPSVQPVNIVQQVLGEIKVAQKEEASSIFPRVRTILPFNTKIKEFRSTVIFEIEPETLADYQPKVEKYAKEQAKLEKEIHKHKLIEKDLRKSVSSLVKVNQRLEYLVHIDALTQITNRRGFDDSLQREWQRSLREQEPLSLIMLDIDYFKDFNDLYGHPAGDRCLTNLAQAVKQALHRFTDLVARYGGEEFIVILPNTTTRGAIIVSDLIQQAIAKLSIVHENSQVSNLVTTSIGITSMIPQDHQQPSILIEKADRALYQAKHEGRNRYSVDT